MRKVLWSLAAVAASIFAGCTPLPTRIAAKPVAVTRYTPMSCQALLSEYGADAQELQTVDSTQLAARRSDAWGMVLLGLPLGRMSGGNHASEIGRLKGDVLAIRTAYRGNGCSGTLGPAGLR